MEWPGVRAKGYAFFQSAAEPWDLGPGIRRDERDWG